MEGCKIVRLNDRTGAAIGSASRALNAGVRGRNMRAAMTPLEQNSVILRAICAANTALAAAIRHS